MLAQNSENVFLKPADCIARTQMRDTIIDRYGISPTVLGRSILSREIECYRIGSGEKYILVAAAHHALESITVNIAFLLMDILMSKMETGSVNGVNCKLLLSNYSFMILTCVNPDGIELRMHGASDTPLYDRQMRMSGGSFSSWQANARGVDLNHNYNFRFAEYKYIERERGITAGPTLYSGEFPESEPEVRTVANLVRTLMPRAVVSLHSQGEQIFSMPRDRAVRRIAERLGSICGYSVCEPADTACFGGLCDYCGNLGIPSFTYELGRGKNPLPESDIIPIFKRVYPSLALLPTML